MSTGAGWRGSLSTTPSTAFRCSRLTGRSWCLLPTAMLRSRVTQIFLLLIGLSEDSTMALRKIVKSPSMVLVRAFSLTGATSDKMRQFDEFGDINCESEMARLDNFAIQ